MTRSLRQLAVVAAIVIASSGLAACGSSASSANSANGSADPGGSGGPNATGLITNLPDLGFKNVKTETAAARGALITADGGTITATGSNGAIYSLVIPPDAMPSDTQIAIYPISSVANLPGGAAVSAGVQITPDGIQLRAPATFTILFPGGVDPKGLDGVLWTGDAEQAHPYPASISGHTVTMHLFHFTAPAVTPDALPLAGLATCTNATDMETLIGIDVVRPDAGERRSTLTDHLRDCYHDYVAPALHDALTHPLEATTSGRALNAYDHWIYALVDAASAVGSQAFTVAPEVADAKAAAITLVHAWYEAWNQACIAHKDDPDPGTPISDAGWAIGLGWGYTRYWGLDTVANGLDQQTLLDRLCVQVVIDPSRGYAAKGPGTTGAVSVNVGITIAGGQLRFEKTHVRLTQTGTAIALADGFADAHGDFTADVAWPTGVDPVQIDILAELDFPPFIARFDRITQGSGKSIQMTKPTGIWSTERWPIVMPICRELFVSVDDSTDWTFSLSGPATETRTDNEDIKFRGTGEGVVAFTASSPTHGSGTYSAYLSVLAGLFHDAAATTFVYVDGHLDQKLALTYDVRRIVGSRQTGDWTNIKAKANRLAATDPLGNAIDLTVSGDQLAGTIGGDAVTLQRDCG